MREAPAPLSYRRLATGSQPGPAFRVPIGGGNQSGKSILPVMTLEQLPDPAALTTPDL
jgi:hypothetical protein